LTAQNTKTAQPTATETCTVVIWSQTRTLAKSFNEI